MFLSCYRHCNKGNGLLKKDRRTVYVFYSRGASEASVVMGTFVSVAAAKMFNCVHFLIKCNNAIIPIRIFIKS